MKLYIAEKPRLCRASAVAMPKPHRKDDGCIWLANGDCVSWCIGHLLEQAEPDAYHPDYKKWQQKDLPIVPEQWQLIAKPNTRKQLTVLRKLVKQADQLVHAGDPDREGQLLVDEVIQFLGVKGRKLATIERLLISDLNRTAVSKALQQLRNNREFIPLSTSALARSRADWLYGINLTRAATLQGRKVGYQGVLSVGRVQTPLLGLVVQRDHDIEHFNAKPFYEVLAHLRTLDEHREQPFIAKWQPSDACQPYMDEEGRVLSQSLADNVVKRISDQPATVSSVQQYPRRQAAPLPYSLSALQIDAAKRFGMSAQQVLDGCQSLYEQHKLITYPRSDCRYLPQQHHAEASTIAEAIGRMTAGLQQAAEGADLKRKSKAWNDKKVSAHHAIIPTARVVSAAKLSSQQANLYQLIARKYLLQFYADHCFTETRVGVIINGGQFQAKAKQVTEAGWKQLIGPATSSADKEPSAQKEPSANKESSTDKEPSTDKSSSAFSNQQLPPLIKGQSLHCFKGECLQKQTQPPKAFTDATLLAAMTGISRFVKDPELRKILKDSDGIGTEATRAGIIELLFKRSFLTRQGKQIRATDAGRGLINSLPAVTTQPDLTARWELILNAIVDRQAKYGDFMGQLIPSLHQLVEQSFAQLPVALRGVKSSTPAFKKRRKAASSKTTGGKPSSSKAAKPKASSSKTAATKQSLAKKTATKKTALKRSVG
jgi:DNA topoisomerase-3